MFEYRIKRLNAVLDGDTVSIDVDMGKRIVLEGDMVRFLGLNCPEIHDKDPAIQKRAQAAKDFVISKLVPAIPDSIQIKMRTAKPYPDDKFGRWLATIYYRNTPKAKKAADDWEGVQGWSCLNAELLAAGHAKPYTGEGVKPV